MAPSILGLASAILGIPTITTFIQNLISALTRNSEYIENVQCTRNQLQEFEDEDLLGKMSILLTPTAYSDGSLNTVIPPYQVLPTELVTNGTFDTDLSGWTDTNNHWQWTNQGAYFSLTSTHNPLSQTLTNPVGVKLKFTFSLNIIQGTVNVYYKDTGNSSVQSQYTQSGTYTIETVAVKQNTDINFSRYAGVNTEFYLDNVSVKEIQEADFDFSRGSSATRVNEQGLVEDVQILSGELVQNGNFEQIGSELVTNGNFNNWTADNPDSWTVLNEDANNYVTQDGTYARIVSNDTASIQIKQTIFTIGKIYKVELDAVVNSGNVEGLKLNDATAAATIGYVNSTGHHTFYFKAAGTAFVINRKGGGDTDISIDNVSVKEVGQNWTFGTGWSMGDGKAINDGSQTGSSLLQQASILTLNKLYKVSYDLTVDSGTISARLGFSGQGAPRTTSGSYTEFLTCSGNTNFDFLATSTYSGSIDNISLIEVTDDTDLPRIDYSPYSGAGTCGHILLEPQRTNSLPYSEDFSNSAWIKERATINANTSTSPDGSVNASKIIENTANGVHAIYKGVAISNNIYTFSCFVKKSDRDYCFLQIVTNLGRYTAVFDLVNGVVTDTQTVSSPTNTSNKIEDYGNGWYRVSVTSSNTSSTTGYFQVGLSDSATPSYNSFKQPTYIGDSSGSVQIWGAQAEAGSYATSYIPTNGSTVTRSADVANNSGNADLFNDSEGVLYAEIAALANDGTFRQLTISDSSTSDRVSIDFTSTDNQIRSFSSSGGSTAANMTGTVTDSKQFNKVAVKYKLNDYALWINGSEVATDTSAAAPVGLQELAFDNGDGGNDFYGKTKVLAVFKEALSNNDLELLTGEGYNSFAALAAAFNYNVI